MYFYYGADSVVGFKLNGVNYVYKKNAQNDIIGIYSTDGTQICKYFYDAWGNQIVKYLNSSGEYVTIEESYQYNDTTNVNRFVAFKNPFRYRSYYYDFETKLYYLNSRYYDPEIGRFINADSLSYLDKNTINGLNLYAYCLNNPIMLVDDEGTSWLSRLWKGIKNFFKKSWDIIVGAVVSAALVVGGVLLTAFSLGSLYKLSTTMLGAGVGGFIGGLQSKLNGGSYWTGYLGGAISGGLTAFGSSIGFPFLGGFVGNSIGTITTDLLNGEDLGNANYWFNLSADSIISGLIAIGSSSFGDALNILKTTRFKDVFIVFTVWAEFTFSHLFDESKKFFDKITDYIQEKLKFSF